jgi:hypothetical protein
MINPELKRGDRVVVLHMNDEFSPVPVGTAGTVTSKNTIFGDDQYEVKWDNGSRLSLIANEDIWDLEDNVNKRKKKVEERLVVKKHVVEDEGERFRQMVFKHGDVWKNFNVKFLQSYLITLRDSGVVNMFGAAPFLYMGRKKMDRYYGENREDDEKFQKVLELADQAQAEMINGVIKYLESKGIEPDVNNLNRYVNRLASNVVQNYMLLF